MRPCTAILLLSFTSFCLSAEVSNSESGRDKRQLIFPLSPSVGVPISVPYVAVQTCGLSLVPCAGAGCTEKSLHGVTAALNEYPWLVEINSDGKQICGGSLIDNQYILTAASCVEPSEDEPVTPKSLAKLKVVWGNYEDSKGSRTERKVSVAYLHSEYKAPAPDRGASFDIAVLKLSEPVLFSEIIQPICLDDGSFPLESDSFEAVVAGYGAVSYNTAPWTTVRKTHVDIISQTNCSELYAAHEYRQSTADEEVCAGVSNSDSCVSDLGGPLFHRSKLGNFFIQSGVSTFGTSCTDGPPRVFTKVSAFKSWIDSVRTNENLKSITYPQYKVFRSLEN